MVTVTWFGPFPSAQIPVAGAGLQSAHGGTQLTVPTDVAAGMLAADPAWWSAVLDGGNATTTYTDGIDGGNAHFIGPGTFAGPGARG